jgi:uncharacterized protein
MTDHFTSLDWLLAAIAATGIGISKSGLAGVSLVHVIVFAQLFDGQQSTGVVLPMLIVADILAILFYRQHARWDYVLYMMPPALIGIVLGWWVMSVLPANTPAGTSDLYKPIIGVVLLLLCSLQIARQLKPNWFQHIPHSWWFAWSLGLMAGFTTMLANAAGPVMALYFLAVSFPKMEFVGTSAWFFLFINLIKVPFSAHLNLISVESLSFNLWLCPCILLGLFSGRWIVQHIPQKIFDACLLAFALIAACRFLLAW